MEVGSGGVRIKGADEPRLLCDIGRIAFISIGIAFGVPGHFSVMTIVIVVVAEVITIAHKSRATAKRHDLQTVPREF